MLDLSPTRPAAAPAPASFSVEEVAAAAGVPADTAWRAVGLGQATLLPKHLVSAPDAVHLVRVLRGLTPPSPNRIPFNQIPRAEGVTRLRFQFAGIFYAAAALLLMLPATLGLLDPAKPAPIKLHDEVKLVYLMMPGPGGGGGGSGLNEKKPPPPAKKKAAVKFVKPASPVPPSRPKAVPERPAPPQPKPEPQIVQKPIDTPPPPPPAPAVQAPVKSVPADPVDTTGVPKEGPPTPPSRGPGNGGNVGSGSGQGIGEGEGGGIGPGSGGGIGGGPYGPGAGIDPPTLVREVRPTYTDEARRQAIEGDVILEIVVRSDGTVGNVRVRRSLGAGLEQRAIDAVRQWRFMPARRHGQPVDVIVDVSVEFKLR